MEARAWNWTILLIAGHDARIDIGEWVEFIRHDWDEVDRIYTDSETMGT